jgi:hypothetical protein
MFNLNTRKYVYKGNCPDRRDPLNPQKRFEFEIDAKTFLPSEKLDNPPIGGVVLCCSQHYAGYQYQTRKHRNDKIEITSELGEKIGSYLLAHYPSYLKNTDAWTQAIRDAVDQTFNGTNNVWKGESPLRA